MIEVFKKTVKSPVSIGTLLLGIVAGWSADADMRFFETEIRPLLADNCYECHGAEKTKGGLRLDHIDSILKGGDSGPALVKGDAGKSLMIEAVRRTDPDFAMPPKKELNGRQVEMLEHWIAGGAVWPAETASTAAEVDEQGFTAEDRAWWAVQPVRDPKPPLVPVDWPRNPIDPFVLKTLAESGLRPSPEAGRVELVRRVYFDLHGLPPSPEQVDAFVNDSRTNALELLIDDLLESPRYGERWAQHWLDVVRYAESDGYRQDAFRSEAYRYRDYVIDSINNDKPYDQFVREQLAGDELDPGNPDVLIGTAFLRHGIYEYNQRNARMHWELIQDEMTGTTGEVFLGLGVGCARCHDHKFDPILQKDYYALKAFLTSTVWPTDRPLATPKQVEEYDDALKEWEGASQSVRDEIADLRRAEHDKQVNYAVGQFPEDIQEIYWKPENDRTPLEQQFRVLVDRQVDWQLGLIDMKKVLKGEPEKWARYEALQKQLKELEKSKPKPLPMGFVATDVSPRPARTFLRSRNGSEEIEPAFLTLLADELPEIEATDTTTGRRTALAEWITRDENPLSTRVIVNRIWQRHFTRGLVATPNDFGTLGEPPSHPELLDWLTSRFLEGGWRMKDMHRLIMTSATYRQTAHREPGQSERMIDPGNRLLWHFPDQRLDAETIRDSMLAVSGELKQRDGGRSVNGKDPYRSVYVKKMRNTPDPVIAGFDAPAGFSSTPDRLATTTPTQSLLLLNGEWANDRARAFAKRLLKERTGIDTETVQTAYRLAYGRSASRNEVKAALAFIAESKRQLRLRDDTATELTASDSLETVAHAFGSVTTMDLGDSALVLKKGSEFEQLSWNHGIELGDELYIEAVVQLDALHGDASVNTLVSRWNGDSRSAGWSVGVTSSKSKYDPRNFIVQLVGNDFQGNTIYEVVASNLRVPLGRPVYLAVNISAKAALGEGTSSTITFQMKDLLDPNAKLETRVVEHQVVYNIQTPDTRTVIGGRGDRRHLWTGKIAGLAIGAGLKRAGSSPFDPARGRDGEQASLTFSDRVDGASGLAWIGSSSEGKSNAREEPTLGAVTDFCHALLASNEFLYLD